MGMGARAAAMRQEIAVSQASSFRAETMLQQESLILADGRRYLQTVEVQASTQAVEAREAIDAECESAEA